MNAPEGTPTSDSQETHDATTSLSASPQDAATRIMTLLRTLLDMSNKTFAEVEKIAEQEMARVGEDTAEGQEWSAFAAFGPFTNVNTAARNIESQIASVRGIMTFRGLDQPPNP